MLDSHPVSGSFSESVDDIISFLSPTDNVIDDFNERDYPWRRLAYNRTLSCPDLARVINDFLSSGVEFVSNDDRPVQLCA